MAPGAPSVRVILLRLKQTTSAWPDFGLFSRRRRLRYRFVQVRSWPVIHFKSRSKASLFSLTCPIHQGPRKPALWPISKLERRSFAGCLLFGPRSRISKSHEAAPGNALVSPSFRVGSSTQLNVSGCGATCPDKFRTSRGMASGSFSSPSGPKTQTITLHRGSSN